MKTGAITIAVMIFAVALFAVSAHAQQMGGMGGGFGGRHHRQAKTGKDATAKSKVDEKAYSAALKGLPDKQFDAWHGVR